MNADMICFQSSIPVRFNHPTMTSRTRLTVCCALAPDTKMFAQANFSRRKRRFRQKAPESARSISDVSLGEQFIGTVSHIGPAESMWIDIGVATLTRKKVNARLRMAGPNASKNRAIGSIISVYVHKIDRPAARIEVRTGSPQLPRKKMRPDEVRMLHTVQLGEEFDATVLGVGPYGAVVDVDVFRYGKGGRIKPITGLLPRKMFRKKWASDADLVVRSDVERIIAVGDKVKVWVRASNTENARLLFGSEQVGEEELRQEREDIIRKFKTRQKKLSSSVLEVGQERKGVVRESAKFGLFVNIGLSTDGLIHFMRMGDRHRWDWKEALPIGTEVTVIILNVDGKRIDLQLVSVEGEDPENEDTSLSPVWARVSEAQEGTKDDVSHNGDHWVAGADHNLNGSRVGNIETENVDTPVDSKEEEEEEEEGGDEDKEKFSDEYFEDKYGY